MDRLSGPALVLDQDDCVVLARQLVEAIRSGYTARGRPPPVRLLDLANEVSALARMNVQASAGSGPAGVRHELFASSCEQLVWTVLEAARVAEVSTGHMRRLIRRGDVEASRGRRGAYRVDTSSLAAWMSRRRTDHERTKVA